MKRRDALRVGEIIAEFMEREHLDDVLAEHRALALWPAIVGEGIDRYTTSRAVDNGIITVAISSAPLRHQLMLSRATIVEQMNNAVGRQVIRDIRIR